MADSSDIDAALIDVLQQDPALQALLPDGVFIDEMATTSAQRFIMVTVFDHADQGVFGGTGWEDTLYSVQAIARSGVLTNMKAAAARIHTVLQDVPLVVPGYTWMQTARERRIDLRQRDAFDKSIYWFLRGGFYRVQMSLDLPGRLVERGQALDRTDFLLQSQG